MGGRVGLPPTAFCPFYKIKNAKNKKNGLNNMKKQIPMFRLNNNKLVDSKHCNENNVSVLKI
jgi:hypothetical protein